jgi:hypothetical protein
VRSPDPISRSSLLFHFWTRRQLIEATADVLVKGSLRLQHFELSIASKIEIEANHILKHTSTALASEHNLIVRILLIIWAAGVQGRTYITLLATNVDPRDKIPLVNSLVNSLVSDSRHLRPSLHTLPVHLPSICKRHVYLEYSLRQRESISLSFRSSPRLAHRAASNDCNAITIHALVTPLDSSSFGTTTFFTISRPQSFV